MPLLEWLPEWFTVPIIALVGYGAWRQKAEEKKERQKKRVEELESELLAAEAELVKCLHQHKEIIERWRAAFGSFAALDVETTGIARAKSRVIQVALVLFDSGQANGRRVWYINPEVYIPASATKVNKITDDMVRTSPKFPQLASELKSLLERYPVVGHNLQFDIRRIDDEMAKLGLQVKWNFAFCTMLGCFGDPRGIYDQAKHEPTRRTWKKLSQLMNELDVRPKGPLHDAYFDAIAAGECFVAKARHESKQAELAHARAQRRVLTIQSTLFALRPRL